MFTITSCLLRVVLLIRFILISIRNIRKVTTAVTDIERLAANLLPIAGRRMMAYLSMTPNLLEEMSRMSPALTRYLESLVSTMYLLYLSFLFLFS